jgi:hypoxanthine phosphoribosyltransferase
MKDNFTARIVNLQEAYQAAYRVANKINNDQIHFDAIVAIARGGFAPGRFLCDFLNIRHMGSVQMTHYSAGASEKSELKMLAPLNISVRDKKILLVDDVNDSGGTLKAVYEHMLAESPKLLKVAVLHEKSNTVFPANYVGVYLKRWKWLIYQWAMTEDVLSFLQRDGLLNATLDKAQQHLLDTYKLKVSQQRLKAILNKKDNYY